jgi:hypothetical protein
MAKKIQVVVDVQSDSVKFATDQTLTLTQQVRLLYKELQKVPEGTKEWNVLQKRYNDTKDNLDKVNVKSKELFGTLSTLPGPVGDFSAKLQGGIDLLKVFSTFTLKDIRNSFRGVAADIAEVFSNLSGGNRVLSETTKAAASTTSTLSNFSLAATNVAAAVTNANTATVALKQGTIGLSVEETKAIVAARGLAAANNTLAASEEAAAAGANALKFSLKGLLAATGIGIGIALLIELAGALMDYFDSSKKAEKAANDFSEAIKRQNELLEDNLGQIDFENKKKLLQAQIAGKSEKELSKIQQDGLTERYNLVKKANSAALQEQKDLAMRTGKFAKISDEERALLLEKNLENLQKLGDQESRAREAIELNKLEAQKTAAQKGREQAIKDNERQRELDKKALEDKKAAYKEDYASYETVLKDRREATELFYDEERLQMARQRFETGISEEQYNTELFIQNIQKNQQLAADEKSVLDARTAYLKQGLSQKLITQKEYDQYLLDAQRSYNSATNALTVEGYNNEIKLLEDYTKKQQEYRSQAIDINNQVKESWYDLASSVANSISSLINVFEQGSSLQKAFAIVSVLINAASAIGKIQLSAAESTAEFTKTVATGTATVASGVALLSNPITAIIGAAQVAAGKAAIATGTAGIGAVKASATKQTIAVGLTSAVQIASILSAKKSGGASAGSGGGAAQAGTPSFNGTVTVPAPQIGASQASQSGTLGQTIAGAVIEGNSRSRPIQTYVVGDQISTQQQLDRRISVAAKMAG